MICEVCQEQIWREKKDQQISRLKKLARMEVYKAIRSKLLKKADKCQVCESTKKVQAHHWHGYNSDRWLDVLWLCQHCHEYHERIVRECGLTTYKRWKFYPRNLINI